MKKFSVGVFLATFLITQIFAPKAHAGAALFIAGGISAKKNCEDAIFCPPALIMLGGLPVMGAGVLTLIFANPVLGVGLLVLDNDGKKVEPSLALASDLGKRYPFIEDRNIRQALAAEILSRVMKSPNEEIHFNSSEILELLSPLDLSQEEIQTVLSDLH